MKNEKDLKNIQKVMFEIKAALLNNEDIRKLLYHDSPDALSLGDVDIELVKDYISFFPVTEAGVKTYDKNTFINITCPIIDLDSEEANDIYVGYFITVVTTKNLWELNNSKIRLIELINQIIYSIDNKKFTLPLKIEVLTASDVLFDDSRAGYLIKTMCGDLQKDIDF